MWYYLPVTNPCSPGLISKTWVNVPELEQCSKDFTCKIQVYIPLAPESLLESHVYLLVSNLGPQTSLSPTVLCLPKEDPSVGGLTREATLPTQAVLHASSERPRGIPSPQVPLRYFP